MTACTLLGLTPMKESVARRKRETESEAHQVVKPTSYLCNSQPTRTVVALVSIDLYSCLASFILQSTLIAWKAGFSYINRQITISNRQIPESNSKGTIKLSSQVICRCLALPLLSTSSISRIYGCNFFFSSKQIFCSYPILAYTLKSILAILSANSSSVRVLFQSSSRVSVSVILLWAFPYPGFHSKVRIAFHIC